MDKKPTGARGELIACTWLLEQGYDVFRNISQHGDVDLIATKGTDLLRIDVKSTTISKKTGMIYTFKMKPEKIAAGIRNLYVAPDGTCEIEWYPVSTTPPQSICENCRNSFDLTHVGKRFCNWTCKKDAFNRRHGKPTPSIPPNHRRSPNDA